MSRRRALVLGVLLIAIVGSVVLVHSRPHQATPPIVRVIARSPVDRVEAPARAQPIGIQPPFALTRAMIPADPHRSARDWMTGSDTAVTAKNEKLFGRVVAHLLALPPSDAWSALTERAHDGDVAAATAAMLLATECEHLPQQVSSIGAGHAQYVDRLTSGLPEGWEPFLRAVDSAWRDRLDARVVSCADIGGVWDFALMALDRFMRPEDAGMQLAAAQDIDDDATAIADLRQLAGQTDDTNARRALDERLMRSGDIGEQAEGRELLEQLAADDPDVVSFLAMCFRESCGHFHGDPSVADAWVERAAGLGDWWALNTRIADLQAAARTTDAWAWALYRLDLAQAGCFETNQPQLMYIAQAAQDVFRLESALSAGQQAQGRVTASAITTRWEAQAAARLGCAG
ncbi:MAG: hypothetical protein ACHP7D_11860 [Lysobacterales bacterium]